MARTWRRLVVLALATTVVSCDSGGEVASTTSVPTATWSPTSGAVGGRCGEATPIDASYPQGPEIVGAATDATLYGLMFPEDPLPINAGEKVKIVWRMTGEGDLSIVFLDPSGQKRDLVFGPEIHGGSNYERPGEEWGSGFLFDEPGCWHIRLVRDVGAGDVWIDVT